MTDDEIASAWLKLRVEDLSELTPQFSVNAYTHSRISHVAFCNGCIKHEGEPVAPVSTHEVRNAVEATLGAIRSYRAQFDGPVLLTWRKTPVIEEVDKGQYQVYCRLALELDRWA